MLQLLLSCQMSYSGSCSGERSLRAGGRALLLLRAEGVVLSSCDL